MAKLNFTLTQLEYVLAVHKYGHFSVAAKHCAVTQPTLSMQIQKLEEELGLVIFDRSKKPILLTEAGAKVIDQMQAVLYEARKIEGLLEEGDGKELSGDLTLGVIPTVAPSLLPRLLPTVQKLYPRVRLKIRELQTHRIVEALAADEIHLGILAIPLGIPQMHESPLYWEPFYVLCRKDDPMASTKQVKHSSLRPDDVWLLEEGHCLRGQVLDVCSFRKKTLSARPYQFESGSIETLKNLVSSFGGYTLVPALAAEQLPRNVALVPLERPAPAREIGIVFRREHYKLKLQKALEHAIRESIPEELRHKKKSELDVIPVR